MAERSEKVEDFVQILHDRAKSSANELLKIRITLASSSIAVLFLAVTSNLDPKLTTYETWSALAGLISMSLSLYFGINVWAIDSRRNYIWGEAIATSGEVKKAGYKKKDAFTKLRLIAVVLNGALFLLGILALVIYATLRILANGI